MNKNYNLTILTYFICMLLNPFSMAAQRFEAGMFVGGSNYIGDLADPKFIYSETGLAYGGLVRYHFSPRWTVRLGFTTGMLQGSDANTQNKIRGFSFSGNVYEMNGLVEWNFLGKPAFSRNGMFSQRVDPYLFIGGALASFTVTAKAPPKTSPYPFPEKDDRNVTVAIPVGGGIKFHLTEEFTLGVEYGNRFTNSDYVDGISTTANPKSKDWYMFGGITMSYIIGNDPFTYHR
jgi:opacity protein-like surface antigen